MCGSRDSVAQPNIVLNTIVAEAFADASTYIEAAEDKDAAVQELIKKYMSEHQSIIFAGNGYSDEWVVEAEKRGLPNIKSMVEAIPALTTEKSVALFERFGVFTKAELYSREEIQFEAYAKAINIEARAMIDIASKYIIPSVVRYTKSLADTVNAVKAAGVDAEVQVELLKDTTVLLTQTKQALQKLIEVAEIASAMEEIPAQAVYYRTDVMVAMEALRAPVDQLEMVVDKAEWPMPSYGDLLFEV